MVLLNSQLIVTIDCQAKTKQGKAPAPAVTREEFRSQIALALDFCLVLKASIINESWLTDSLK